MYQVIYFSRGGNTQKVAAAIAGELGVKPVHIRWAKSLPEETDIFLGSGLYFMRPARMVRNFIRSHDLRGKKIAIFGTSTSGFGIETLWMEWRLKRKGAIITGKYYCAASFALRIGKSRFCLRGGRPSDKDFEGARQFARSVKDPLQAASLVVETGPLVA
jgi:flavodoxin